MTHHLSREEGTITSITLIAIVAKIALLGVVVVTVAFTIPLQQQAEAAPGCEKGLPRSAPAGGSIAANASKGRCAR
jgi:hypothetical protein